MLVPLIVLAAQTIRFPIAVWLQDPSMAQRYKAAGFNLYVGLWQGPTEKQLSDLSAAHMPVICEQNAVGLAHLHDPIIYGWMHGDEPDNAQELPDGKGYGPCIPPQKIVDLYGQIKQRDPSRPVLLNLGQGVANDSWIGRGNGAKLSDYETYVKGGDIVSFDVYPVAGLHDPDKLWYVSKGIDRLIGWTAKGQRVWNCIECTNIDGSGKPTPEQVRAEAWMAILHGSRGLTYFVHQFKPTFDEHALLDDPQMLSAVTNLNAQIEEYAPMFDSASAPSVHVQPGSTVEAMCRKAKGSTFIIAVETRNQSSTAMFSGLHGSVEVVGEHRTIQSADGTFGDRFSPYQVHIYKAAAG